MELTADLLKSLNNIRQNATIYVHAYHYTNDEKCVMAPRSSLPSLKLTVLQSEKIIDLLLSGSGYIRHDGYVQGYGEKTVATFTIQGEGRHRFKANLSQNGESDIASNALNHWLHRIHKTDIIVLSVVLMQ
ncbi:hypothetical protein [Escherichia coli]|uniref:hypothetical protein n=1 Tax=Escherichia coli TaxID=562 RepID=UPI001E3B25CB|nr:hypothetical protein [Escherichia coli]MCC5152501.1 hypothetical protein [Escherichia coli]